MKKTRIVATYGPSIASTKKIRQLVEAGVNLFRINCSHGKTDDFLKASRTIRDGCQGSRFPIGLLLDISGPKLRLGRFDGELAIKTGDRITLTTQESDLGERVIEVNHPAVIKAVKAKHRVYIDDGNLGFQVVRAGPDHLTLKALNAGILLGGKGINLPDSPLDIPTITRKDKEDIKTAVKLEAEYIALSFVRSPDDVLQAKRLIKRWGGHQGVIAKLEKSEAIDQLDAIMDVSDGVMVARGDLGVEMPPEDLPKLQKMIIKEANKHRIPVIVATQMLESMRFRPRATRAEINDVASAVFDHADGVMLSAETAAGQYPLKSVRTMAHVIESTESAEIPSPDSTQFPDTSGRSVVATSIADAVTRCKADVGLIFAITTSGFTATLISKLFPAQPIIAVTSNSDLLHKLSLYRSVYPILSDPPRTFDEMLAAVTQLCRQHELAARGDKVIITGGLPFGSGQKTNMMMVHELNWSGKS